MLQQTQVKTVIPYWSGGCESCRTFTALAKAEPEKVLKLWEGLGYYTRARNLQRAAQMVISEHRGKFPNDFNEVLALPGVGRYTAGRFCSLAFNQPVPVLDGNVIRVLTRCLGFARTRRTKPPISSSGNWPKCWSKPRRSCLHEKARSLPPAIVPP